MGYIKSHSNYVIKKHHQLTNDGTIYERDITTIGGLNQFAKGQTPIYQSGNFIITVNNDSSFVKDYSNNRWVKNSNSQDEVWTLTNISGVTSDENDTLDVIRQDYYSLRDFAYYGSCSELIRASITDIINRFPGELYAPKMENGSGITMYYTDKSKQNEDQTKLYKDGWFLLDNPFNINIYTKEINKNDIDDELKYFCNNGYKNYLISNTEDFDEENDVITSWTVESYECGKPSNGGSTSEDIKVIAKVTLTSAKATINIVALKGDNGSIVYLTNSGGLGYHIRPKNSFYKKFIKSLDSFQTVLLNTESKPKYSVLFEIIRENSFGYYTEMKRFTFPTTFGGYNLSVTDPAYFTYLNSFIDIANYYDETFCDNLYRSMCHEAIKNFDWSYTREYSDGDSDDYIFGGTRMQNALRLIAREFDELKYYIDGIGNANILSYNSNNNMPNEFLSDSLINDGWDVTSVTPFIKNSDDKFIEDESLEIYPYSSNNENVCYKDGYFIEFTGENCNFTASYEEVTDNKMYQVKNGVLKTKIKQFFSDTKYTMDDVNNLFMKVLRLNSRQIYRHKGSIEGIEMILSLFGLRSKRWYDKKLINKKNQRIFSPYSLGNCGTDANDYDYEIKEYLAFASPLEDPLKYQDNDEEHLIDWYNQTKTVTYNTDDYRNGIYNEYQGLPVKYYDSEDSKRYLLPYFDKDSIIDGDPSYQLYGGWLWKNVQFNSKDTVVTESYTETIKNVPSVSNLKELFGLPYNELINGTIYQVRDISVNYIIIDGVVYDIYNEYNNGNKYEYFNVTVSNNSVKVGQQLFIDSILVSSPYGTGNEIKEELHYLDNYNNGDEIRIYIINNKCSVRDSYMPDVIYLDCTIFKDGKILNASQNNLTNYFQITNKNYKNKLVINGDGWKQLTENDSDLKKIDNLENYFNGNNPHTGNMKYDSGAEYLSYFKTLFKYAIENEEFDPRCYYGTPMEEILKEIGKIGFDMIDEIDIDKIDYFGDYYQSDKSKNSIIQTEFKYNEENTSGNNYNITTSDKWSVASSKFINGKGYTEQIVNVKRVDIIFNISKTDLTFIKYVDDVIIKYLSQMIPHNTIVKIIYNG